MFAPLFIPHTDFDPRGSRALRRGWVALRVCALALLWLVLAPRRASAQADLPPPDAHEPISVNAQQANRWTEGNYEVWLVSGNCLLRQGPLAAQCDQAVFWIERASASPGVPRKMITYLDGHVTIDYRPPVAPVAAAAPADAAGQFPSRLTDEHWLGRLFTLAAPQFNVPNPGAELTPRPAVYLRAMAARSPPPLVQQAQFTEAVPRGKPVPGAAAPPPSTRRIRAFPRSDVPVQIQWVPSPGGNEYVAVVTSGVNLIIDGLPQFGSIDVSTDRLVLWTTSTQQPDLAGGHVQSDDQPLEIYLEGNVVFRQGERIVQAQAMYYDARQEIGTVLNAELLTPLPTASKYPGLVRLRANVMRQVADDHYVAQNASFTTSRMGDPTYDVRSGSAEYFDRQIPVVDPATGQPVVDPRTGLPKIDHEERLNGTSNFLYFNDVPVFYWPYFSADLEHGFFLREIELENDSVFGTRIYTEVDTYQLLGIENEPKGTTWDSNLDYMSKRGFFAGTEYHYDTDHFFAIPGKTQGMFNAWFTPHDRGLDDLGLDRRALVPEQKFRGRLLEQHREQLPDDWQVTLQVGYITDRNFLEEYLQREWDSQKDESTELEVRKNYENQSFSLTVGARINDFFTETDRLPQLDHYWLGQPLLGDNLSWYEHTNLGYLSQGHATTPTDPADAAKFTLLPWESPTTVTGSRLATRNEFDLPLQLGPVKVVPYILGEVAHWDEDLDHDAVNRAYGVAGMRASLPMWGVDPSIQSGLFNVNGVAHKIDFAGDFSFSQSTANVNDLPLYDQLNDDSVQHFERRFEFNTFGLMNGTVANLPLQFDPRYYALRRGMDEWVTGPTEIAGDLTVLRLDVDQRWQTKRGAPGEEHIIDWITLDTSTEIYPDSRQDFGSVVGLTQYDFQWFVGDRVTVVSNASLDWFNGGEKYYSGGFFLNRPPRGNCYMGFFSLEGPFKQQAVVTAWTYRMTPKWAMTFGSTFNVGTPSAVGQVIPSSNIAESFTVTRIGESFLMTLGVNVDASRGTVGASFLLEPRVLGKSRLAKTHGLDIPAAGVDGLE